MNGDERVERYMGRVAKNSSEQWTAHHRAMREQYKLKTQLIDIDEIKDLIKTIDEIVSQVDMLRGLATRPADEFVGFILDLERCRQALARRAGEVVAGDYDEAFLSVRLMPNRN